MYQIFVDKYAALVLSAMLAMVTLLVGISALSEFLTFRRMQNDSCEHLKLLDVGRKGHQASAFIVPAIVLTVFLVSPTLACVALCTGALIAFGRFARRHYLPVVDLALWVGVGVAIFAGFFHMPEAQPAVSPLGVAFALTALPLLRLRNRYDFEVFWVKYAD